MDKLNGKTEEIILIVVAFIVLGLSFFSTTISAVLAIVALVAVWGYNRAVSGKKA